MGSPRHCNCDKQHPPICSRRKFRGTPLQARTIRIGVVYTTAVTNDWNERIWISLLLLALRTMKRCIICIRSTRGGDPKTFQIPYERDYDVSRFILSNALPSYTYYIHGILYTITGLCDAAWHPSFGRSLFLYAVPPIIVPAGTCVRVI